MILSKRVTTPYCRDTHALRSVFFAQVAPTTSCLLFKNKDFGRHHFNDRLTLSRDVFGVTGISTWAGSDPSTDRFSGFSIRANRHGLFCADSSVREEPEDGTNYDVLTEIALNEGFDVDSAVDALKKALRTGPYWCANLIMIDPFTIAVVEVRSDDLFVTRETNQATRTNHHVYFGPADSDHDTVTSEIRLECSSRRLSNAEGLGKHPRTSRKSRRSLRGNMQSQQLPDGVFVGTGSNRVRNSAPRDPGSSLRGSRRARSAYSTGRPLVQGARDHLPLLLPVGSRLPGRSVIPDPGSSESQEPTVAESWLDTELDVCLTGDRINPGPNICHSPKVV